MSNKTKAERSVRRHTAWGIFWILNFPAVTAVFFLAPETWEKASVLYLVYVSLYANAGTEFGARQAAKAVQKAEDNVLKRFARMLAR